MVVGSVMSNLWVKPVEEGLVAECLKARELPVMMRSWGMVSARV